MPSPSRLQQPVRCLGCFISRMEVLHRIGKDEGERAGRLAYEPLGALPTRVPLSVQER